MAKRIPQIPDRSEVTDDTPLLLDVAARMAFPDGSVSGPALRRAAARNELEYERIGGRLYTTLAAIGEMRALSRRTPTIENSGTINGAPAQTGSDVRLPGKSTTTSTSTSEIAQKALRYKLDQILKRRD